MVYLKSQNNEFQYVLIPCTNIIQVLQCVAKHQKMNLNQMFIGQTAFSLPETTKSTKVAIATFANAMLLLYFVS